MRELCLLGGQAITEPRDIDDPQAVLAGGGDLAGCIGDDDREAHGRSSTAIARASAASGVPGGLAAR